MKIVKKPLEVGTRVKAKTKQSYTTGKGTVLDTGVVFDYIVKLDNGNEYAYRRDELTKLKKKLPDVVDGWDVGDQQFRDKKYVYIDESDDIVIFTDQKDWITMPLNVVEAAIAYRKANPLE